jgi:hypothetical protein
MTSHAARDGVPSATVDKTFHFSFIVSLAYNHNNNDIDRAELSTAARVRPP